MGICRKERMIAKGQLARWKSSAPVFMAFGMELILVVKYLWIYTEWGLRSGTKITPCVLAFLFKDGTIGINLAKVMVYLGIVLVLSEAPFMDEVTPYIIVRSKRGVWWRGECLYIWVATLLYMLFITIVSIFTVLPTVTWTGLWGSTVAEIVKDGNMDISHEIVKVFYPSAVLGITFISGWISMVMLGHVAYAVSLATQKRIFGLGAIVFLVLLDPIVKWLGAMSEYRWMYWISPISWSSMENWNMVNVRAPMEVSYIFSVYAGIIIVCTIVIAFSARRKQIDVVSLQ